MKLFNLNKTKKLKISIGIDNKKTLVMEIYCVKCKRKTPSLNIRHTTTKNNKPIVKGSCSVCGTQKNCFTKSKAGGKLDIHSLIGKLPKPKAGWTPTNYKYMGPFNPLDKQLEYDPETGEITRWMVPPYNKVDEISAHHDVCYSMGKNKNECDKKMVSELDKIPYGSLPKMGMLARKVINTKQKLGLGVLKKV